MEEQAECDSTEGVDLNGSPQEEGTETDRAEQEAETVQDLGQEIETKQRMESGVVPETGLEAEDRITIHMDPVEVRDDRVTNVRMKVTDVLKEIDDRLTLHDFRVVEGTRRTNLIFDLVVPRDYTKQMQDACKQEICRKLRELDERYCCVITAECTFCMES